MQSQNTVHKRTRTVASRRAALVNPNSSAIYNNKQHSNSAQTEVFDVATSADQQLNSNYCKDASKWINKKQNKQNQKHLQKACFGDDSASPSSSCLSQQNFNQNNNDNSYNDKDYSDELYDSYPNKRAKKVSDVQNENLYKSDRKIVNKYQTGASNNGTIIPYQINNNKREQNQQEPSDNNSCDDLIMPDSASDEAISPELNQILVKMQDNLIINTDISKQEDDLNNKKKTNKQLLAKQHLQNNKSDISDESNDSHYYSPNKNFNPTRTNQQINSIACQDHNDWQTLQTFEVAIDPAYVHLLPQILQSSQNKPIYDLDSSLIQAISMTNSNNSCDEFKFSQGSVYFKTHKNNSNQKKKQNFSINNTSASNSTSAIVAYDATLVPAVGTNLFFQIANSKQIDQIKVGQHTQTKQPIIRSDKQIKTTTNNDDDATTVVVDDLVYLGKSMCTVMLDRRQQAALTWQQTQANCLFQTASTTNAATSIVQESGPINQMQQTRHKSESQKQYSNIVVKRAADLSAKDKDCHQS